jgi:hypothetical protein
LAIFFKALFLRHPLAAPAVMNSECDHDQNGSKEQPTQNTETKYSPLWPVRVKLQR